MPSMLDPAISRCVNLDPLVIELRRAKRPTEAIKRVHDFRRRATSKIKNDECGTVNQWEPTIVEVIVVTCDKDSPEPQSFRSMILIRLTTSACFVNCKHIST